MNIRRGIVLVTCIVVFGMLGGTGWAAPATARVDIAFDFAVEGGTMAAGTYDLMIKGPNGGIVSLRNTKTGKETRLSIKTRLAEIGTPKVSFVFDKSADTHFLSEIHVPNMDGYALQGASGEHAHEKVAEGN